MLDKPRTPREAPPKLPYQLTVAELYAKLEDLPATAKVVLNVQGMLEHASKVEHRPTREWGNEVWIG